MKNVLITGASRGIGRETARLFHSKGYNVIVNYNKSKAEAETLVSELENSEAVCADVSDLASVRSMVDYLIKKYGTIDVLVNNAGIAQQKLFTDITQADWNRMISVNLGSVYNLCSCVVPHMVAKKSGKIINVSSMWGITGASCEVHYSAAKAAVVGFTKALAKELGPSNINVNAVAPGTIMTDMCGGFDGETLDALAEETPLCRLGTPADVAGVIYFLADDASSFMTGQVLSADGGMVI